MCVNFTFQLEEKKTSKTTRRLILEKGRRRSQGTMTWQMGGLQGLEPHVTVDGEKGIG